MYNLTLFKLYMGLYLDPSSSQYTDHWKKEQKIIQFKTHAFNTKSTTE